MDRFLLNHIKELEKNLSEVKEKEDKLQKITNHLKKMCQSILDLNKKLLSAS